jgi:hypothetical protein
MHVRKPHRKKRAVTTEKAMVVLPEGDVDFGSGVCAA